MTPKLRCCNPLVLGRPEVATGGHSVVKSPGELNGALIVNASFHANSVFRDRHRYLTD